LDTITQDHAPGQPDPADTTHSVPTGDGPPGAAGRSGRLFSFETVILLAVIAFFLLGIFGPSPFPEAMRLLFDCLKLLGAILS